MKLRTNGVELQYSLQGSGPPLVWVSGTGIGGGLWHREQIPVFARDFTCLTFDLRGTGESGAPEEGYSVENMATDVVGLIEAEFGSTPVSIIGFSLGSAIVQQIALTNPHMLSQAILLSTWSSTSNEEHIRRWFQARLLALRRAPTEVFRAFSFWMWSPTIMEDEPELIAELEGFLQRNSGDQPLHAYEGHFEADLGHDTYDQLHQIGTPTLVLYGEEDLITLPQYNRTVAQMIPGAQIRSIRNAGHFACLERGGEVNNVIEEFLTA